MSKTEIAKRYGLFVISLFFIGLGIALTKHGELGISPISSVANVMSFRFPQLSFGTWIFISNMTFLLGQIVLLRRRFQPVQLLQIPLSMVYGYFTDFGLLIEALVPNETYVSKVLLVIVGGVVLAFGIALSVIANAILPSAEAFVKALAQVLKKGFGGVKIAVDGCWVAVAVILSMCLFGGQIVGVREGTLISVFLVGGTVKVLRPRLQQPVSKLFRLNDE